MAFGRGFDSPQLHQTKLTIVRDPQKYGAPENDTSSGAFYFMFAHLLRSACALPDRLRTRVKRSARWRTELQPRRL